MNEEEKKAIVLLRELRGLYEATADDYEYRGTLSIQVDEDDSDAIDTILNLIEKQHEEKERLRIYKEQLESGVEILANGIRVLGTNPNITTEEIIKGFTENPISEEYMKKFESSYISKDKIRDKIKQLEDYRTTFGENEDPFLRQSYFIKILKELLED